MITTKNRGAGLRKQVYQEISTHFADPFYETVLDGYHMTTVQESISGFHRLKRLKVMLPATLFNQVEWNLRREGSYTYGGPLRGSVNTTSYPGPPPEGIIWGHFGWLPDESDIASVIQGVDVDALLQRAVSAFSAEFDALTWLAELREVPGMLLGLLNRVATLLSKFQNPIRVKDIGRGITSDYLETRYGWLPVKSDLENIRNVIESYNKQESEFIRHRSRYGFSDTFLKTWKSGTISVGGASWKQESVRTTQVGVSGLGSATSRIRPIKIQCDPISTAWELIPYSFVIDWVLGVGQALAALRNRIIHYDMVTHTGLYVNIACRTTSYSTDVTAGSASFNYQALYTEYRTIRSPKPVTFYPQIKLSLSWLNCLDALALAVQRIYSVLGARK